MHACMHMGDQYARRTCEPHVVPPHGDFPPVDVSTYAGMHFCKRLYASTHVHDTCTLQHSATCSTNGVHGDPISSRHKALCPTKKQSPTLRPSPQPPHCSCMHRHSPVTTASALPSCTDLMAESRLKPHMPAEPYNPITTAYKLNKSSPLAVDICSHSSNTTASALIADSRLKPPAAEDTC